MISSKDFIMNTAYEYPGIVAQGITPGIAFDTVTLYTGVPEGADYHVFQKVVNGTYGTGYQKVLAWIDSSNRLRASTSSTQNVYWRIYGA